MTAQTTEALLCDIDAEPIVGWPTTIALQESAGRRLDDPDIASAVMATFNLHASQMYDPDTCRQCGDLMEWVDCWQTNCNDGFYQPYLDDLGPEPGDPWEPCLSCHGKSGWYWCPSANDHVARGDAS